MMIEVVHTGGLFEFVITEAHYHRLESDSRTHNLRRMLRRSYAKAEKEAVTSTDGIAQTRKMWAKNQQIRKDVSENNNKESVIATPISI